MSEYDLMRLFEKYDSEICEGDFTPEELMEYLAAQDGADRSGAPHTLSEWKAAYFSFYDDVKDKSLKKQDW